MKIVVQAASPQLSKSKDFYERAGFDTRTTATGLLVYDSTVFLSISGEKKARSGFLMYDGDVESIVSKLKELTKVVETKQYYLFAFPSGTWAYLYKEDNLPNKPESAKASILGQYAGISLESVDVEKSMQILSLFGFIVSMGGPEQGWVAMSNAEGFTISIMKAFSCPHMFYNPSLTYFNSGKNLEIIDAVRKANIPITEEITAFNSEGLVDNIIIRDPGGLGFFIFND